MACGGDRVKVNCGVELSGKTFVLCYKVGKDVEKKNVTWDWVQEEKKYVAKMEAKMKDGTIKYHNSNVIDADIVDSLGKPDKSLDGSFYKVKLKKKSSNTPDLQEFFST